MSEHGYFIGTSDLHWRHPNPRRHAVDPNPAKYGVRALCGVDVMQLTRFQHERFDPDHPRACPGCRRVIRWAIAEGVTS